MGKFVVNLQGNLTDFKMRLNLASAEAQGTMLTDRGNIEFRAISHANKNLNLVAFKLSGNEQINISHLPLPMIESNHLFSEVRKKLKVRHPIDYSDYSIYPHIANFDMIQKLPKDQFEIKQGVNLRHVSDGKGSGYTLSWQLKKITAHEYLLGWRTDYLQQNYQPKYQHQQLLDAMNEGYDKLSQQHSQWWASYFDSSYLSIPDKRIEANLWVQLYKMGAATGKGKLPVDLLGPWFRATPWPRIWANLNVQLSYLSPSVANKPNVAGTLADFIDAQNQAFIRAVPEQYQQDSAGMGRGISAYGDTKHTNEYGNFLWLLYDYWHFLRVYPDENRTTEKFYPMLKRGINFLLHNSITDADGLIHTPADISPEYKWQGSFPVVPDTSYNLALLRWAMNTAIRINRQFSLQDQDIQRYQQALNKLAPLQIDADTGIMIGKGIKVEQAHRHYSHLVGLYPLKLVNLDNTEQRDLYQKTLDHWINQKVLNHWSYKGYSRTGASAMYILLDQPDEALRQLNMYMDQYLLPNTFYLETGPVIETPLSSAATTQELLLQSWSPDQHQDLIRLFPGAPTDWSAAHFDGLRAEGGYRVSASLQDGKTEAFEIIANEQPKSYVLQLRLKTKNLQNLKTSKGSIWQLGHQGVWQTIDITLKPGESLSLNIVNNSKQTFKRSAAGQSGLDYFHFGLNRQSQRGKKINR